MNDALETVARLAPNSTPTAVTYVLSDGANIDHKVMVFMYPGDDASTKAEFFFHGKIAEARQQAIELLSCEDSDTVGLKRTGAAESEAEECPATGDARTRAALAAQSRLAETGADVRGVEVQARGAEAANLLAATGRDNVLSVEVIDNEIRLSPILKSDAGGTGR